MGVRQRSVRNLILPYLRRRPRAGTRTIRRTAAVYLPATGAMALHLMPFGRHIPRARGSCDCVCEARLAMLTGPAARRATSTKVATRRDLRAAYRPTGLPERHA